MNDEVPGEGDFDGGGGGGVFDFIFWGFFGVFETGGFFGFVTHR